MGKKRLVVSIVVVLCIIFGSFAVAADRYTTYDLDRAKGIISELSFKAAKTIEAPIEAPETPEWIETPKAYISFTFDDNHANHLDVVAPILAEYNMIATRYYISETNNPNFDECKILRDKYGWEIGGHTRTHPDLTLLPRAQLYSEIQGCQEDFSRNGIEVNTFAPPYSRMNETVKTIVKEYYGSCRDGWGINAPPYDPYNVKMIGIDNAAQTSITTILAQIDNAKETSGWIVFIAHRVDYTWNDYSTDESFSRNLVRLVSEDPEIRVTTISETLEL